ncbi:MAG: phosphoglycerate kinase [Patescibacteria group bacterium]|nr:phosphoglycerate kinase [Patescibacteria group bacterium]
MSPLISVKQLSSEELKGKRVLLRSNLNVPVNAGEVVNAFRLEKAQPTIEWLIERGAKVLLLGHLSRQDGSLRPVAEYFNRSFPTSFIESIDDLDTFADKSEAVVVLENLRHRPGEIANDPEFAKRLVSVGDLYVNDDFTVSHRRHTSIIGLPTLLPSYAGLGFVDEVEHLSVALEPEKPFVLILGGAKFDTKVPLVKKFLPLADRIFIGGALASSWLKVSGKEVGSSLVDNDLEILKPFLSAEQIMVPVDVIIKTANDEIKMVGVDEVPADASIVDIGPKSLRVLAADLSGAKTILWNGPLGYFEEGFSTATEELAHTLSDSQAKTIIGGGDTVAAIEGLKLMDKFTFVSTAGGAMLDFLADGALPGITALKESQQKFNIK